MFDLAKTAVALIARHVHPDAHAVILLNDSDEGAPYLNVYRIVDRDGNTLWTASNPPSGQTDEQKAADEEIFERFVEYAQMLDRDINRLEDVGTRHEDSWKLTL